MLPEIIGAEKSRPSRTCATRTATEWIVRFRTVSIFSSPSKLGKAPFYKAMAWVGCIVSVVAFHIGMPGAQQTTSIVRSVGMDRFILTDGQAIGISYLLSEKAQVSLFVYTPDYEVIRKLVDAQWESTGNQTVFWDGKDNQGILVPDEAYLFSIKAVTDDGRETVYDPTRSTGGAILDVGIDEISSSDGQNRIQYAVAAPARVNIRAGIRNGPLLKTLMNWKPLPAGTYVETWDGLDETGNIRVLEQPNAYVNVMAFSLPENSMIVQSGNGTFAEYTAARKADRGSRAPEPGDITYTQVKDAVLERAEQDISPHYIVLREQDIAPEFSVFLADDRTTGLAEKPAQTLSGSVPLVVEVSESSLPNFNEMRFEVVVFVDNKRFDEEENAYSPYTYHFDTTRLPDGDHPVTVNLASITDQVCAACRPRRCVRPISSWRKTVLSQYAIANKNQKRCPLIGPILLYVNVIVNRKDSCKLYKKICFTTILKPGNGPTSPNPWNISTTKPLLPSPLKREALTIRTTTRAKSSIPAVPDPGRPWCLR